MTLRSSDSQSESDLDSIRNSCDVFYLKLTFGLCTDLWDLYSILVSDEFDTPSLSMALQVDVELGEFDCTRLYTESK